MSHVKSTEWIHGWKAWSGESISGKRMRAILNHRKILLKQFPEAFRTLVELDGMSHCGKDRQERDAWRTSIIEGMNISVLRIHNGLCMQQEHWQQVEDMFVEFLFSRKNVGARRKHSLRKVLNAAKSSRML